MWLSLDLTYATRGSNFFSEKALNCEQSKAAAAIIYNHGPGHFLGTVGDEKISIPVFEALQSYGHDIISNHLGEVATIEKRTDYEYATGTSMASPHAYVMMMAQHVFASDLDLTSMSTVPALRL